VTPWAIVLVLLGVLAAAPAAAQSTTAEADVSVGQSTDGTSAGAAALRLFGATRTDWRYFLEGTWGHSSQTSDAFASAYPYDGRFRAMEMFVEKTVRVGADAIVGVRGGRYRTPFGISSRSDYAYGGLARAPLIRYGQNFALSNTSLETGADVLVGVPAVSVEASAGVPSDESAQPRRAGLDTVVRVQAFARGLIVGASFLQSQPSMPASFANGHERFGGIDARWMAKGVQLRGEWVAGRPFDRVTTNGGYLDAIVHVQRMGRLTGFGRIERLDYYAGRFSTGLRRGTIGGRFRISQFVSAQADLVHQPSGFPNGHHVALDLGLTINTRFTRP
jgi:hypothetical protein